MKNLFVFAFTTSPFKSGQSSPDALAILQPTRAFAPLAALQSLCRLFTASRQTRVTSPPRPNRTRQREHGEVSHRNDNFCHSIRDQEARTSAAGSLSLYRPNRVCLHTFIPLCTRRTT